MRLRDDDDDNDHNEDGLCRGIGQGVNVQLLLQGGLKMKF